MATEKKQPEQKTVTVQIIKSHPLYANEVDEVVEVLESSAKEMIEKKIAKEVKQ